MLTISNRLRLLYLLHFSNPAGDRQIYRDIHERPPRSILEIGIGLAVRSLRMIDLAGANRADGPLRYTGIDLFEARSPNDGPGLDMKSAYRLLRATGSRVTLAPGDPQTALRRIANALGPTDLVVVSSGVDAPSMARAWFYVPRLLHAQSRVFVAESAGGTATSFRRLTGDEIERLAGGTRLRRAA